ncbi:Non-canonical ubiquitin-conjugating enzyme 1 [Hyphodiscus hymeniophilus]|uniref:Non-canonical ubiquitin-conjugating enzyme 1 n=1 Tax=Hyphodiscus hymeniophilus TaxID=353542 RepID=A0A9P6VIZ4_9HELO|nr:Non-canonical ubiquitin-conjugating enzyme 1 [Hyphodiscus hymeniophilus]
MAASKLNTKSPTVKRILREAAELSSTPSPDYHACPASDEDIFEWHFTLRGPPSSAFADGIYHGRIVLPSAYPLRPPSFRFLTPSGRFETNREICLSISGHHEETWQPAWGIRTALVALRAFMETDAKGQLGGLDTSEAERRRCADSSANWKCGVCAQSNREILDERAEAAKAREDAEGSTRVEQEVPKELTMKYKEAEKVPAPTDLGEEAELAEGFVQTTPVLPDPPAYPPARPVQGVPLPTGSISSGNDQGAARSEVPRNIQQRNSTTIPQSHAIRERAAEIRRSTDGLTLWIDRAIAGVVVCLIFMVLRMLLTVSS